MDSSIICTACKKQMANAITLSCCQTVMCRGCAVRNLVRNKKCGNPSCLTISSLDQVKLTPNLKIRNLCQKSEEIQGKEADAKYSKNENNPTCESQISQAQNNQGSSTEDNHENKQENTKVFSICNYEKIQVRQLFHHPSFPIPSPLDLYSLDLILLHYLALQNWSFDALHFAITQAVLSAHQEDITSQLKQLLENLCTQDDCSGKYVLKKDYYGYVSADWPYYSSTDRQLFTKRGLFINEKCNLHSNHISELLHILALEKKSLDYILGENEFAPMIPLLPFFLVLDTNDFLSLKDHSWYFIQPSLLKCEKQERLKVQCTRDQFLQNFRRYSSNEDLRYGILINSVNDKFQFFEIANLYGISEDIAMKWFLSENTNSQIQNHESQNLSSVIQKRDYEYPTLFTMYSFREIALHRAAIDNEDWFSKLIAANLEQISESKQQIAVKKLEKERKLCCTPTSDFTQLKPQMWMHVDVNWPLYPKHLVNRVKEKRPNLATKISTIWTKKVSLDVTDFHVMLHILALKQSTRPELLSLLKEKIHGFPDIPDGLVNLLAAVENEKFCLRLPFWYFVQASSPLFTEDEKLFILKKKKSIMKQISRNYPKSDFEHDLIRLCLMYGMVGEKISPIFGVPYHAFKMSTLNNISRKFIRKKEVSDINFQPKNAMLKNKHKESKMVTCEIVFLDFEILNDGNQKQFTQIGCFSNYKGFENQKFWPIVPQNIEQYNSYKQSKDLLGMLNYVYDPSKDRLVYQRDDLSVDTVEEKMALEQLGEYFDYVKSISQCSHLLVLTNSTEFQTLFQSNAGKYLRQDYSCLVISLKEFLASIPYPTHEGEKIDTDDLYKEVMKKDWDQQKPHCGETSKYLYSVINKLSEEIDLLKTKISLELLLSEENTKNTNRSKSSKSVLESIEVENSYRPNFPFTIELRFIDVVDLTEKSEGSEVIDISDDSLTSLPDVDILEHCKCNLMDLRQINNYGVCNLCPIYDLVSCEDVILQPGMLTSFVVTVRDLPIMKDSEGLAVKLVGDSFYCDPIRHLYYGTYTVITIIHNTTCPDPSPLFFHAGENVGKCQIFKSKLPNLNLHEQEMPISVDYNELIPNVYNRPVALRINFPFGSIVRVDLKKQDLVSEKNTAVVQMKNILHLSLRSKLPSTYVQIGEVIGKAKLIHPRTWIKEKVLGFNDGNKGSHTDKSLKKKQETEKSIKSEPTFTKTYGSISDVEPCSAEEECRPKMRLNFDYIGKCFNKNTIPEGKTTKVETNGFKIDDNRSHLRTKSTLKKIEERKFIQANEKHCVLDNGLVNDLRSNSEINTNNGLMPATTNPADFTQNTNFDSDLKETSGIFEKGEEPKIEKQELDYCENTCITQSDHQLRKTIVQSFSDGFTFNFQVVSDQTAIAEDDMRRKNKSNLILSFGEELQRKSDNDSLISERRIIEEEYKSGRKSEDIEHSNKKKADYTVIGSILDTLLNNVQDVSLMKEIKTLCSRGEKDNLKILLSQTQNLAPRVLSEPLNEVVCKSAQFYDISKMLLDHGASVETQDDDGNTALHYAVQFYPTNKQTVDLLLERGSKTTIKNALGCTPVVMADDSELKALMKELKQPKNRTKLAIKKIVNKFKNDPTPKRVIIEEEHFPSSSPGILKKRKRSFTNETPTKRIKLSDKIEYFHILD